MPGNLHSGRPKSAAALAAAAVPLAGELLMPKGMLKEEKWLWSLVVDSFRDAGILAAIDAALLRSACELWNLYRKAFKLAKKDPTDKDARIAVTNYWHAFETAASRLGMNPLDRSRLRPVVDPKKSGIKARRRN
jgi:P27 family predicted phage terminase small subunit